MRQPRTNGHRISPLSEASRQALSHLVATLPTGVLVAKLRSSPETVKGAVTGAAFLPSTRQRLETAIARVVKEHAPS
jgi:hypothetical protein